MPGPSGPAATTKHNSAAPASGTSTLRPVSAPSANLVVNPSTSARLCPRPSSAHASVPLVPADPAGSSGPASASVANSGAGSSRYPVSSNSTAWSVNSSWSSSQPSSTSGAQPDGSVPDGESASAAIRASS